MKNFRFILLLGLFFGISYAGSSQNLSIRKESKKVSFKKDHLLEIFYTQDNQKSDCDYCNHKNFKGYFLKESKDSLQFKIIELHQYQELDDMWVHKEIHYKESDHLLDVSKKGVFHITNLKSKGSEKRKHLFDGLCGVFVVGSAITGIASLFAKGDSRKRVGLFSLAQLGIGITFGVIGNHKNYSFKPTDPKPWIFD